ncbi:MAG: hypothetical protein ACR2IS_20195 [Nitrososphaeraceae archaeon]
MSQKLGEGITLDFATIDNEINFAKDTKEAYARIQFGIDDPTFNFLE